MPPLALAEDIVAALIQLHMNNDVFGIIVACRDLRNGMYAQQISDIDDRARKNMLDVLTRTIKNSELRARLIRLLTECDLPVDALLGPDNDGWAGAGYKLSMYNFVRCRPLLYTFIAAMFETHSLASYYAETYSDQRFHIELAYLYLFNTDFTVSARLQETLYSNIDDLLKKINEYFERFRDTAPSYDYPMDFVTPCEVMLGCIDPDLALHSYIPPTIMTSDTNELLMILVAGIPVILQNWDALVIKDYVQMYNRIARESPRLSAKTPMGLYVHFCFMTPTHLKFCVDNLRTLLWLQ